MIPLKLGFVDQFKKVDALFYLLTTNFVYILDE